MVKDHPSVAPSAQVALYDKHLTKSELCLVRPVVYISSHRKHDYYSWLSTKRESKEHIDFIRQEGRKMGTRWDDSGNENKDNDNNYVEDDDFVVNDKNGDKDDDNPIMVMVLIIMKTVTILIMMIMLITTIINSMS